MRELYAIKYQSMATGIIGLLVYEDRELAEDIDSEIETLEDEQFDGGTFLPPIDLSGDGVADNFLMLERAADEFDFSDIDNNDVQWHDEFGEYIYEPALEDDVAVIIVNNQNSMHSFYGLDD